MNDKLTNHLAEELGGDCSPKNFDDQPNYLKLLMAIIESVSEGKINLASIQKSKVEISDTAEVTKEETDHFDDYHFRKFNILNMDKDDRKIFHDLLFTFDKKFMPISVWRKLGSPTVVKTLTIDQAIIFFCCSAYHNNRSLVDHLYEFIKYLETNKTTLFAISHHSNLKKTYELLLYKRISPPHHHSDQPHLTIPSKKKGNNNYFANAVLKVIGREKEEIRLKAFLECDEKKVSWFQIAGVAGQGKSRLALDLVNYANDKLDWNAGFLKENDMMLFQDQWKSWRSNNDCLIVFDYIIGRENKIKPIVQTLIARRKEFDCNVRILFLERQRWDQNNSLKQNSYHNQLPSSTIDKSEWFLKLCEREDYDGDFFQEFRFDNGVMELKALDEDCLVDIAINIANYSTDTSKGISITRDEVKETLRKIDGSGRPLYAYLLGQELYQNPKDFQKWSNTDLLTKAIKRESLLRWKTIFKGEPPAYRDNHPAINMAVLATMVREVKVDDGFIKEYFGYIDSSLIKQSVAITDSNFITNDTLPDKISALEPDLLGEWFVLNSIQQGLEFKKILDVAWKYDAEKMASFIQRASQDFANNPVFNTILEFTPQTDRALDALSMVASMVLLNLERLQNSLPIPLMKALKRAAEKGDSKAITNLGFCYSIGLGVDQSWQKAIDLYQSAVEKGDCAAMFNLGFCYMMGQGVEENLPLAIDLYQQAVEKNDVTAMFNLALCYERGMGIKQDLYQAINLYQKAVDAGDHTATSSLQNVLQLEKFIDKKYQTIKKNIKSLKNITIDLEKSIITDPPLIAGNWREIEPKEADSYISKFIEPYEMLGIDSVFFDFTIKNLRRLPLSFYKDCFLVDLKFFDNTSKKIDLCSSIISPKGSLFLNGESGIIYGINSLTNLLNLTDLKSALDYLQFYNSYVRYGNVSFQVVTSENEVILYEKLNKNTKEKIRKGFFKPRYIDGSFDKEGVICEACLLYENTLQAVTFKILSNGFIDMLDEKMIAENLPIFQRQYDGVFRTPLKPHHN